MGLKISSLIDCSSCANYVDSACTSTTPEVQRQFSVVGRRYGAQCEEFESEKSNITSEIQKEHMLRFMLAGCSEFIMVSGKTGTKIRYKLDQKVKEKDKSKDSDTANEENKFIYWLNTSEKNGTLVYAGVLFFDSNDNQFKFGKGARGNLTNKDVRVQALLYVLNNLYKNNTAINVKVYHVGKCGKCGKKLTDPISILSGLGPTCSRFCGIPRAKI